MRGREGSSTELRGQEGSGGTAWRGCPAVQLPEGLKLRVPRAGPRFSPVAPLSGSLLSSTRLLCDSENKPAELLITAVLAPAVRYLIPHLAGSDLPS